MMNRIIRLLRTFVAYCRLWGVPLALKVVVLPKLLHRPGCKHKAVLAYIEKRYSGVIDSYRLKEAPAGAWLTTALYGFAGFKAKKAPLPLSGNVWSQSARTADATP